MQNYTEAGKKPLVSIIVPVWNHVYDLTRPFLETLREKTNPFDYELIIVNNGSNDQTKDFLNNLKEDWSNLKVIHLKNNKGFAGGNNAGYRKASGEYICFTSNDVMVQNSNWLKVFIDTYKKNKNSVIGQNLIDYNTLTTFMNEITPYLSGHILFSSKKVFDSILLDGMIFDENFGTAYFEDVELSVRIKDKGYSLIEVPELPVHHLISKTADLINVPKSTVFAKRHFNNVMTWRYLNKINKKRIVFFHRCPYPYIDSDFEGKGVGGSEAAIILLAREFAKNGWKTEIYNTTQRTGMFGGVEYFHISEFKPETYMDVFVLFREPLNVLPQVNAVFKIFWSCDQYTVGNWQREIFPYVDKVIAISKYHHDYLEMAYGPLNDKLCTIELGVNINDYKNKIEKVPGKLIYCSVPLRGLKHMVGLFQKIKSKVPYATLSITSDYRLWGATENNSEFKDMFKNVEGVKFYGKLSRKELFEEQKQSEVMTYPCEYEECFCISAMECIAAGAIPVTTKIGALKTTVSDSGVLLSNVPGTQDYDTKFVDEVVSLLTDKKRAEQLRNTGISRAEEYYSFSVVYSNWNNLINNLTKRKESDINMVVCEKCEKKMANSYVLAKHMAKMHNDAVVITPVETVHVPTTQLMKFKQYVEFFINGKKYSGKEIEVEFERVGTAVELCKTAYGPDILAI